MDCAPGTNPSSEPKILHDADDVPTGSSGKSTHSLLMSAPNPKRTIPVNFLDIINEDSFGQSWSNEGNVDSGSLSPFETPTAKNDGSGVGGPVTIDDVFLSNTPAHLGDIDDLNLSNCHHFDKPVATSRQMKAETTFAPADEFSTSSIPNTSSFQDQHYRTNDLSLALGFADNSDVLITTPTSTNAMLGGAGAALTPDIFEFFQDSTNIDNDNSGSTGNESSTNPSTSLFVPAVATSSNTPVHANTTRNSGVSVGASNSTTGINSSRIIPSATMPIPMSQVSDTSINTSHQKVYTNDNNNTNRHRYMVRGDLPVHHASTSAAPTTSTSTAATGTGAPTATGDVTDVLDNTTSRVLFNRQEALSYTNPQLISRPFSTPADLLSLSLSTSLSGSSSAAFLSMQASAVGGPSTSTTNTTAATRSRQGALSLSPSPSSCSRLLRAPLVHQQQQQQQQQVHTLQNHQRQQEEYGAMLLNHYEGSLCRSTGTGTGGVSSTGTTTGTIRKENGINISSGAVRSTGSSSSCAADGSTTSSAIHTLSGNSAFDTRSSESMGNPNSFASTGATEPHKDSSYRGNVNSSHQLRNDANVSRDGINSGGNSISDNLLLGNLLRLSGGAVSAPPLLVAPIYLNPTPPPPTTTTATSASASATGNTTVTAAGPGKSVESVVLMSCYEILSGAANQSLKAVELANTLRARVGTEALAKVRERWGGLLSLIEKHQKLFRVDRIPKNDKVTLINKLTAAPRNGDEEATSLVSILEDLIDSVDADSVGRDGIASPGLAATSAGPQQQMKLSDTMVSSSSGYYNGGGDSKSYGGNMLKHNHNTANSGINSGSTKESTSNATRCLHVGNVPGNLTEVQLMREFEKFGHLDGLKLVSQRNGTRRFAFVTFRTVEQAITARHCLSKLHPWKSAISFAHREFSSSGGSSSHASVGANNNNNNNNNNNHGNKNQVYHALAPDGMSQQQQQQQQLRQKQKHRGGSSSNESAATTTTSRRMNFHGSSVHSSVDGVLGGSYSEAYSQQNAFMGKSGSEALNNILFPTLPHENPYGQQNYGALLARQGPPGSSAGVGNQSYYWDHASIPPQQQHMRPQYSSTNTAQQINNKTTNTFPANSMNTAATATAGSHVEVSSCSGAINDSNSSCPILRRLCDDTYVPTQPWPVDVDRDQPYCAIVIQQLHQFGGFTTVSKLRGFLRNRIAAVDNVKSVPLKAMLAAYSQYFILDGNYVSLNPSP